MDKSQLAQLPDELLAAIVSYLSPHDTVTFGFTSRRHGKITREQLIWRRHCAEGWRFWSTKHEFAEKLTLPPAQVRWRKLYKERLDTDEKALNRINALLQTQVSRISNMEQVAALDYDVVDLLLRLRDHTPQDAEDVLAREFHANAILGQTYRAKAIDVWLKIRDEQPITIEEALYSYDMFVLNDAHGSLADLIRRLDEIALQVEVQNVDFNQLSTRRKAVEIARYLRSEHLVGNPRVQEYHALRNNFITMAILDDDHASLPLQSAAIYCAVARRLGVNASPSGFPNHVYVVVEASENLTLDGAPRSSEHETNDLSFLMYMDPWRNSQEVELAVLHRTLSQIGLQPAAHSIFLRAAPLKEIVIRVGRNLMQSVSQHDGRSHRGSKAPNRDRAWYAALWVDTLLEGDIFHYPGGGMPFVIRHYQEHHPEDLGLIQKHVMPMYKNEHFYRPLLSILDSRRKEDGEAKYDSPRLLENTRVKYKIGCYFRHRRYGYLAVVIRWDSSCIAGDEWIEQMRVEDLSRGRDQPFYQSFVGEDMTTRYVAEENIIQIHDRPTPEILEMAGRWFKRWDSKNGIFVSNIKDEFPDD